MGFFSGDSKLVVEFYDDPAQTLESSVGSVRYTMEGDHGPGRIAHDFARYTKRVVSNLGPDPAAYRLAQTVGTHMGDLTKRTEILSGPGFRLELVAPRAGGATKTCEAVFWETRGPNAKFSRGGESYYPAMSCLLFLQYIVNHLDAQQLDAFGQAARGEFGIT